MNGGAAINSADDALRQRVARLEAEVAALRGDLAALRASEPSPLGADSPTSQAAGSSVMPLPPERRQRTPIQIPPPAESLESRLGIRVVSKIGVILLLIGAAWFLKWAFDNRWIGPAGRVFAGLLAGTGVILWSERFRRQQLAGFGYALKATGSGVLYLSLWASFHLYHLVPAWVAFVAMVAVTAWNAVMAWSQDEQLQAGYALLGAYLTPLLLRMGGDHEVFLFSYLLMTAAALLALLRFKPWNALLLSALAATAALFTAWYSEFFTASGTWTAMSSRTAIFALLLWAVFAAAPLLTAQNENLIALLEVLGAGAFGALTIYSVLVDSGAREWQWIAMLIFAIAYFGQAYITAAFIQAASIQPACIPVTPQSPVLRAAVPRRAAAAQLVLAVAFLTAAITLKATGRAITLGWLAEALILLVIGFWKRAALLRFLGLALLAATLIKTFAWDLRGLGTAYRVVSYLGLGVLLMAVSFAYQKEWLRLRNMGPAAPHELPLDMPSDPPRKPPRGEARA